MIFIIALITYWCCLKRLLLEDMELLHMDCIGKQLVDDDDDDDDTSVKMKHPDPRGYIIIWQCTLYFTLVMSYQQSQIFLSSMQCRMIWLSFQLPVCIAREEEEKYVCSGVSSVVWVVGSEDFGVFRDSRPQEPQATYVCDLFRNR